ncbi:YJL108Cp-like protein [Nadsonia fulvescens var. elongata DSM 6958]|uniref:YJL108Cp-like protein n=1 Tax=Nadsonia fulvescens var. elongata DSM 6958 TaxID=857566 RepID=A0A1E3PGM3_9ASCO|nr:YJL108Cp-like protein [Nadsonia fulvescens var. elongata DSM 6958]
MGLVFGSLVGTLQIIVAPKSDLYNNIFEVSCAILVSFLSRALGSIKNGKYFCYTAIVQGSITLILPGYVILCGSLEIQSKNIVSGAVRMIYAIVYSLFLGFGISVGATIYGLIDSNAVSVADGNSLCNKSPLSPWFGFLFVPVFVVGIALVNQARWMQIPAMIIIASAGYAVTYFVDQKFPDSAQLTSAIGAFVIGILGNIHSRLTHGLGFAAMLPAIFILIPFCLASQGSIINGIQAGNGNSTHDLYTTMSLGSGMLNISVGLTVGLFSAALVVYPAGKKRSGLFTF